MRESFLGSQKGRRRDRQLKRHLYRHFFSSDRDKDRTTLEDVLSGSFYFTNQEGKQSKILLSDPGTLEGFHQGLHRKTKIPKALEYSEIKGLPKVVSQGNYRELVRRSGA